MKRTRSRLTWVVLLALTVVALSSPDVASAAAPPTFTMGQHVVVEPGQVVEGDLLVVNGDVTVQQGGLVTGDVAVALGDATIAGEVGGDVWASGDLSLAATAVVGRDAAALGRIERSDGAHVVGQVLVPRSGELAGAELSLAPNVDDASVRGALVLAGITVLLVAAFAALATAVARRATANVRDALMRAPRRVLLLGLVATVLLPFVVAALVWFVLPVVPVALCAWALLLAVGGVGLSERLGVKLIGQHGGRSRRAALGGSVAALPLAGSLAVVPVLNEAGASGSVVLAAFACVFGLLLVLSFLAVGAGLATLFGMRSWPGQWSDDSDTERLSRPAEPLPGETGESLTATEEGHLARAATEAEPVAPGAIDEGLLARAATEAEPAAAEPIDEGLLAPAAMGAEPGEPGAEPPDPGAGPLAEEWEEPVVPGEPMPSQSTGSEAQPEEAIPLRGAAEAPIDIRGIPGVGPIHAHLLTEAGLGTVESLAAATPEAVLAAIEMPGVMPVSTDTATGWIAAARALWQR